MWPRMLFELLPHFARLMPMADKYLSSRSASEKAQAAALAAMAGAVRGELGRVTEASAGVSRQLQEQGAQIADLGVEVARARLGVESVEARVAKLEKIANATRMLLAIVVGMMAIALVLLVFLLVHGLH